MSHNTCGGCHFWVTTDRASGGQCYFLPPALAKVFAAPTIDGNVMWENGRPWTTHNDFCTLWQPDEKEPPP